ncbi:ATP-binding cassette domain-containing protein [Streptomyces sp. NPDC059861]|uniref:ABC transporter ATP-binding protein n=1 Tax=Streptomyces sp. NPDC059861 TaxID=3346974 RepID=UPI003647A7E2
MIQAFGLTSNSRKDLPPAVDDVSFEAPAGRVTALLGDPGAGKTTALRLMLELQPGRGITYFRGRPLHRIDHPSHEVGVLLGDVPGHPGRTVRGHLRMLCAAAGISARRADEVLEVVGLVSLRDECLGTLSRGMDRRMGLACALLPDPHTLVLDQSAEGLSTRESNWLYGMLRAHAAQGGTVLVTTSDPKEAARTADRVVTLERGRVVADQEAKEFARTRLRPRVVVQSPHAARLAAVLTKEARTAHRSVEVVMESGNRLSVYGSTCADVGEAAFRHNVLVLKLADEIGDMGPGAGTGATPLLEPQHSEPSDHSEPSYHSEPGHERPPAEEGPEPDPRRTGAGLPRQSDSGSHKGTAPSSGAIDREAVGGVTPGKAATGAEATDEAAAGKHTLRPMPAPLDAPPTAMLLAFEQNVPTDANKALPATGNPLTAHESAAHDSRADGDPVSAHEPTAAGNPLSAHEPTANANHPTAHEPVTKSSPLAAGKPHVGQAPRPDRGPLAGRIALAEHGAPTSHTTPDRNTAADRSAAADRGTPTDRKAPADRNTPTDKTRALHTPATHKAPTTHKTPGSPEAPHPSPPHAAPPHPSTPKSPTPQESLPPLPPPISVHSAPSPLRPLRYELRRATGISTGFVTSAAVLAVSALTALVLARIGHTPQARLLAAWPQQLPLPPAALGAGLLGALAFGEEFRHPALAADRGTVPRRLGLLTAKLLVAAGTALALAILTVGCDAEVLYLVYGQDLAQIPGDWLSLSASWFGLMVGCAWAGVLAAGVFRSTTAGLAAVLAVPVLVVPLVQKVVEGSSVRAATGLPMRMRQMFLLQWPFGGERYLEAAARVVAQPVGSALTLSLTALLCAYLFTTLRSRVR